MVMQSAPGAAPRSIGRYVLYGEIAAGGMATVHFGRIQGAGGFTRPVAIKRLHAQFARDPEFVSMFLDEARLASRIFHPNVVATLDVVQTDDQELFLVMEYVRGASLSKLIRSASAAGQRIPPRIAAAIVSGLLHGLHAAHEAKADGGQPLAIVHRDVSPQNVLVGTDGVARVLDFGVAKAADRMQSTRDGQLKGKIAYMSPEQVRADPVDRRTDVYASGVVLWEALTGDRLFKADNQVGAITKVLEGKVPRASEVAPGVPPEFDRVVAKALAKEAADRYATAREMAAEVEACAGVANATEIGEWVEGIAAEELHAREARIAEVEGSASSWSAKAMSPPSALSPSVSSSPDEAPTRVASREPASGISVTKVESIVDAPPVSRARSRRPLFLAAIGGGVFLVLALAVGIGAAVRTGEPNAAKGSTSTNPTAVATTPVASVMPSATPLASASASGAAPAAIAVDALPKSTPTATSKPPATATAIAKPATTPANNGAAAPKPDCNPPFTTDDKGHVHFKPQCM